VAKKFQRYSYEFKLEAVRLLMESGKTLVEQAEELGINHVTLWAWKKKLGDRVIEAPLTTRNAKSKLLSKASHQAEFSVRLMCRLLDVSVSGFYAYLKRGLSKRAQVDSSLILEIEKAHRQSRKTYGSFRIHRELRATGLMVSENRVARLM
jgi:transposase-like protein